MVHAVKCVDYSYATENGRSKCPANDAQHFVSPPIILSNISLDVNILRPSSNPRVPILFYLLGTRLVSRGGRRGKVLNHPQKSNMYRM